MVLQRKKKPHKVKKKQKTKNKKRQLKNIYIAFKKKKKMPNKLGYIYICDVFIKISFSLLKKKKKEKKRRIL